jgi:hypothetical protein
VSATQDLRGRALVELGTTLFPSSRALQRAKERAGLREGLALGLRLLPRVGLGLALGFFGSAYLLGHAPFSPWLLPLLLTLAPLATALAGFLAQRREAISSYDTALLHDQQNAGHDRLSAAHDLSEQDPGSGRGEDLALAAIEDGLSWLSRCDPTRVRLPVEPPTWSLRAAVAGILLALLPALLPQPGGDSRPGRSPVPPGRQPVAGAPDSASRPSPTSTQRKGTPPGEGSRQETGGAAVARAPMPEGQAAAAGGAAGKQESATAERGGSGGASAAGESQSSPRQPTPEGRRATPKPLAAADKAERKSNEGAPPGGAARGRGRMSPIDSPRAGRDRGAEREDDPEIEDEAAEDEPESSEQRGGVSPLSRDRDRPVSRELSISGTGPPRDGRGGPTPPKKHRGTASLILGTPLPDHVRGRPNPGTSQTSVEAVPPRREPAPDAGAAPAVVGEGNPQPRQHSAFAELLRRYHEALSQTR